MTLPALATPLSVILFMRNAKHFFFYTVAEFRQRTHTVYTYSNNRIIKSTDPTKYSCGKHTVLKFHCASLSLIAYRLSCAVVTGKYKLIGF